MQVRLPGHDVQDHFLGESKDLGYEEALLVPDSDLLSGQESLSEYPCVLTGQRCTWLRPCLLGHLSLLDRNLKTVPCNLCPRV